MDEFSTEPISGDTARVKLLEDVAILTPKVDVPVQRARLQNNIKQLKLLRELTSGLPGLKVPKVLEEDPRRCAYKIERALGLNLSEHIADRQGDIRAFLAIPLESKIDSVIAYLRMVGRVNAVGLSFNDHKVDSVFIEPSGDLTVVDAGGMVKTDNPWSLDSSKKNGLYEIVAALFNRSAGESILGVEPFTLIPAGVECVLNNLNFTNSADDAAEVITSWRDGTLDLSTRFPYNMIPSLKAEKELKITDYQRDMDDARRNLQGALRGDRMQNYFQYLDRRRQSFVK